MQLTVSSVELLDSNGDVTTVNSEKSESFNMLDYRDGETLRVVSADGELDGHFIGLRMRFDDTDSYVRDSGGTSLPLELLSSGEYADIDVTFDGTTSASLVVDLDLRFSLIDNVDALGVYQMVPVLRVADADTAGEISGTINANVLNDSDCRNGRDIGSGVAIYVYPGSDVTPTDYYDDGSATSLVQPVASTNVNYDSDTGAWLFHLYYIAPGVYTVAWTCEADAEKPRVRDDMMFRGTANLTLGEAQTATLEF